MLEMAKVKFEYFREKLGVLQIEVPSKGKLWDLDPFWHGERIRFLPWTDVRDGPLFHGERIWFLPCHMWVLSHFDVTVGLVPTWSDISVECHSWNGGTWSVTRNTQLGAELPFSGRMEAPGQLPGITSLGLRAILIWLWDVFSHDQIWFLGHSDK